MAKINSIKNIPNPNTQSPDEFEEKTTVFLNNDLPTFINEANDLAEDLTGKWSNVNYWTNQANDWKNETLSYKNDAENAKNTAYGYKVEAVNAANNIQNYVIPSETTYSTNEIDAQLSETARVQVAQQIILAYLQQN